jgi:hypothetical protein
MSETPAKLDFSRADEKVYAEVMRNFSRFVWGACKSSFIYSTGVY